MPTQNNDNDNKNQGRKDNQIKKEMPSGTEPQRAPQRQGEQQPSKSPGQGQGQGGQRQQSGYTGGQGQGQGPGQDRKPQSAPTGLEGNKEKKGSAIDNEDEVDNE